MTGVRSLPGLVSPGGRCGIIELLMSVRWSWDARRQNPLIARAVVVMFVCLLAAAPLSHHDVACHLKSTTHCTLCLSAPVAGDGDGTDAGKLPLSAGEWVNAPAFANPVVDLVADAGGRSPPLA